MTQNLSASSFQSTHCHTSITSSRLLSSQLALRAYAKHCESDQEEMIEDDVTKISFDEADPCSGTADALRKLSNSSEPDRFTVLKELQIRSGALDLRFPLFNAIWTGNYRQVRQISERPYAMTHQLNAVGCRPENDSTKNKSFGPYNQPSDLPQALSLQQELTQNLEFVVSEYISFTRTKSPVRVPLPSQSEPNPAQSQDTTSFGKASQQPSRRQLVPLEQKPTLSKLFEFPPTLSGTKLDERKEQMKRTVYTTLGKALNRFRRAEYFAALKFFNKVSSIYQIQSLSVALKKQSEHLYNHIVDNYLCQCLCYIKLHQSSDVVHKLMSQLHLLEPSNVDSLFLRGMASQQSGDSLQAGLDETSIEELLNSTTNNSANKFIHQLHQEPAPSSIKGSNDEQEPRIRNPQSAGPFNSSEFREKEDASPANASFESVSTNISDVSTAKPTLSPRCCKRKNSANLALKLQRCDQLEQEERNLLKAKSSLHKEKTVTSLTMALCTCFLMRGYSFRQIVSFVMVILIALYLKQRAARLLRAARNLFRNWLGNIQH